MEETFGSLAVDNLFIGIAGDSLMMISVLMTHNRNIT